MDDLLAMLPRIRVSPYVPEGQVYILNDLELDVRQPDGWDAMTAEEKVRWATENGMLVLVRNLDDGTYLRSDGTDHSRGAR